MNGQHTRRPRPPMPTTVLNSEVAARHGRAWEIFWFGGWNRSDYDRADWNDLDVHQARVDIDAPSRVALWAVVTFGWASLCAATDYGRDLISPGFVLLIVLVRLPYEIWQARNARHPRMVESDYSDNQGVVRGPDAERLGVRGVRNWQAPPGVREPEVPRLVLALRTAGQAQERMHACR